MKKSFITILVLSLPFLSWAQEETPVAETPVTPVVSEGCQLHTNDDVQRISKEEIVRILPVCIQRVEAPQPEARCEILNSSEGSGYRMNREYIRYLPRR